MNIKKFINEFINDCLRGDINNLKTFSLEAIKSMNTDKKNKYGCPGRNFDCDDTEIAKAIYCAVWGDVLPNLTFEKIGAKKQYRGDTMNTIATILSSNLRNDLWKSDGTMPVKSLRVGDNIPPFCVTDSVQIDSVRNFLTKCGQIGNMMILSNNTGTKLKKTLNLFRESDSNLRDYMPLFLQELQKCLADNSNCNEYFKNIFDQNDFYFGQGQDKIASFEEFCKKNYIDDAYWNEDSFKFLFDEKSKKYSYWKNWVPRWNEADKANYFEVLNQYIDSATPLIDARTDCIIDELKKFLK